MTQRDLFLLACRLFAAWLFVQAATWVGAVIIDLPMSLRGEQPYLAELWSGLASAALDLLIAVYLWKRANRIADRAVVGLNRDARAASSDAERIGLVALQLLGLYFLITGLMAVLVTPVWYVLDWLLPSGDARQSDAFVVTSAIIPPLNQLAHGIVRITAGVLALRFGRAWLAPALAGGAAQTEAAESIDDGGRSDESGGE